jgi:hypothetical protein
LGNSPKQSKTKVKQMSKLDQIKARIEELKMMGFEVKVWATQNTVTIKAKSENVYIIDFETKGTQFPCKMINPTMGRTHLENRLCAFLANGTPLR